MGLRPRDAGAPAPPGSGSGPHPNPTSCLAPCSLPGALAERPSPARQKPRGPRSRHRPHDSLGEEVSPMVRVSVPALPSAGAPCHAPWRLPSPGARVTLPLLPSLSPSVYFSGWPRAWLGDAITSRPTAGRCQLALCHCPSGHTVQCGRWLGSWPRPWNGVEG